MTESNPAIGSANTDAALPKSAPARRVPPVALVAIGLLALIIGASLAMEMLVVERLPQLTIEKLEAAEKLWQTKGPPSYDLDLVIEGAQPGIVHVEVRDGVTTAMQRDGRTPSQPRVWDVWTVPGTFDTIAREFQLAEDPQHEMQAAAGARVELRARFDPTFGYPARFHRIVFGGGPEVFWKVTSFQPR